MNVIRNDRWRFIISLNFTDVFSESTHFNTIKCGDQIHKGRHI